MEAHFAQSNNNEWYTPARYLDAAHALMGGIDVDPASCASANERVRASTYYTIEDDGFNREWPGRVFLNPPYGKQGGYRKDGTWNPRKGKSNQELWAHRLIAQFKAGITTQAILLVTAVTSERWFQPLWDYPICFTHHRVRFLGDDGNVKGGNTKGTALVYMGPHIDCFYELFSPIGNVVVRYRPGMQRRCAGCGGSVDPLPSGRLPRYCNDACKQRAYRDRVRG